MCLQARAISSRHWIYTHVHLCLWPRIVVDCRRLKKVWYAPDFLSNCSTCVPLAAPGITRSPSKRICRCNIFAQETKCTHPTGCGWPSSPACPRLRFGTWPCTLRLRIILCYFVRKTNVSEKCHGEGYFDELCLWNSWHGFHQSNFKNGSASLQSSNSFSLENDCIWWSSSHPADAMPPRQPFAPGFPIFSATAWRRASRPFVWKRFIGVSESLWGSKQYEFALLFPKKQKET